MSVGRGCVGIFMKAIKRKKEFFVVAVINNQADLRTLHGCQWFMGSKSVL